MFSKTKRRRLISRVSFPALLVPRLERHLAVYRPLLCGGRYDGEALWVSRISRPQSAEVIAWNINNRTRERFERHVNLQLFRKCKVTTFAIHAPKQIHAASTALGHSNMKTTTDHYNLANAFSASIQLNATLDKVVRAAKDRKRLGVLR